MSLDTLAHVKTRLSIASSSDDTLLGLLQDSADTAIANYCSRNFEGGTFTEYFPGGSEFVHLRNFPVASVTSVKVDASRTFGSDTVVTSSDYVVQSDRGVIQSVAGQFLPSKRDGLVNSDINIWTRGPGVIQVVYTTPTSSVPSDVKEAYARLVGHWYRKVKTEVASSFLNVSQQKFGETFQILNSGGPEFPGDVVRLLAPYRVPLI